jgi:hypothetical protein
MPSDHYAPATNQRVASCLELALDRAGCFDATALETAIRARRAQSRDGEALPLDLGAQRALRSRATRAARP